MVSQSDRAQKQILFWQIFEICLLAVIFYIPFGIAFNISSAIDLASIRVLCGLIFLAWLIGKFFLKEKFLAPSFQGFGLAAIVIVSGLSLFVAGEFNWGLRKLLVFLSIFPLFFVVADFASRWPLSQKIIKVLLAGATVSGFIATAQFFGQFFLSASAFGDFYTKKIGPIFWGQGFSTLVGQNPSWFFNAGGRTLMRAFGLFPDPHMLAFFLGLILPLVFAQLLFAEKDRIRIFLTTIFLGAVLLLTFSRGGYLGIFFSGAVVLALSWKYLGQKRRFLMAVGFVLGLLALFTLGQPIIGRFFSSFSPSEGSSAGRLQIWHSSLQVFFEHPLLGVGLGNYPLTQDSLAPYRNPITSHNLYFDAASETGVFGLIAWLGLVGGTFFMLYKKISRRSNDAKTTVFLIGLAGSLAYFAVHSFFETAIFNPAVLATLMVILALAGAATYEHGHLA